MEKLSFEWRPLIFPKSCSFVTQHVRGNYHNPSTKSNTACRTLANTHALQMVQGLLMCSVSHAFSSFLSLLNTCLKPQSIFVTCKTCSQAVDGIYSKPRQCWMSLHCRGPGMAWQADRLTIGSQKSWEFIVIIYTHTHTHSSSHPLNLSNPIE